MKYYVIIFGFRQIGSDNVFLYGDRTPCLDLGDLFCISFTWSPCLYLKKRNSFISDIKKYYNKETLNKFNGSCSSHQILKLQWVSQTSRQSMTNSWMIESSQDRSGPEIYQDFRRDRCRLKSLEQPCLPVPQSVYMYSYPKLYEYSRT